MSTAAPWLAHYDPDVPATLAPYPARTLVDYLADAARDQPDKAALLFKGATMTYGRLARLSDACAAAFAALGVRRGDRIGLLLPNCPQFFIAEFGAWKLGAVVAPLNPIYTEHELEGPLRDKGVDRVEMAIRVSGRANLSRSAVGSAVAVPSARVGGAEGGRRRRAGRGHPQARRPAQYAPFFCDPSPRRRLRHPHRAGTARACRREYDDGLSARAKPRRARRSEPARPTLSQGRCVSCVRRVLRA